MVQRLRDSVWPGRHGGNEATCFSGRYSRNIKGRVLYRCIAKYRFIRVAIRERH